MFDEFNLFESTSFDDIMNDSYAAESYDLFNDSYGYAFEADEAEGDEKRKGIGETIKKILAKFKEFVANFLQGIKNFLFGAKDEKGAVVKFGVAGYIGGLWKAAKADAEAKLRQEAAKSNESKFLAIESSDFSYAFEASDSEKLDKLRKKRDKFEKEADDYTDKAMKYLQDLKDKAKEAGDANISNFFDKVIKSAQRMTFTESDTDELREYKQTWNESNKVANAALKTAEDTGKGANKEGDISKFKAFIGTLSRFFKYLGSMIKLMVMSKVNIRKWDKYSNAYDKYEELEQKNGSASSFIGRIAFESYNEGYQAALREYDYDRAGES